MEAVLKLAMDYQESLVFRRLAQWFSAAQPDTMRANHVYTTIFRDLGYLARGGSEPGRIKPADQDIFRAVLALATDRVEDLFKALIDDIRLFVRDGDDLVCMEFAAKNGHISPNAQTKESRGGVMRAFYKQVERGGDDGFQLQLNIQAVNLVDEHGVELDHVTVKRMKWLVVACDGALGKPTRPGYHYSPDLIQHAVRVLREYDNSAALAICEHIARNRMDPRLKGYTTEMLLPVFGQIMESLKE